MGLADALRNLSDTALAELFAARPDLMAPPAGSFAELANRASSPHSVERAVDDLDEFHLQLLEALLFLERPSSTAAIAALDPTGIDRRIVADGLTRLRHRALLLGDDDTAWSMVRSVRQVLPPPFGLGPRLSAILEPRPVPELQSFAVRHGVAVVTPKLRLVEALVDALTGPERISRLIEDATDDARELLVAIHNQGSYARLPMPVYDATRLPAPLRYWMDKGVLYSSGWDVVVLPREAAVLLRGGSPFAGFTVSAPAVVVGPPARRDGAVDLRPPQVVDHVAAIIATWGHDPPAALRTSGVGVKDVRAMAKSLGLPERGVARLIELAGACGLLVDDYTADRIVPTTAADVWLRKAAVDRWLDLVEGWRALAQDLSRAGARDHNDKPVAPMARGYPDPTAVWRRSAIVRAMAELDSGTPDEGSVGRRVRWAAPGRWLRAEGDVAERVADVADELALLGLARDGALTELGRAALLQDRAPARALAATAFPPPVSIFTVGADLTALAPAELDPAVRVQLDVMAEVESRGVASMYRFTDKSLRRAVDRGYSGPELLAFLEAHARPSVPQGLAYLVEDVARRYGSVRVGSAASYIRCEDPALLAEIARAKKTSKAKLRVIAPTVAVSPVDAAKVLAIIREAGYLPALENAEGGIVVKDREQQRTKVPSLRPPSNTTAAGRVWAAAPDAATAPSLTPQGLEAVRKLRAAP